MEQEKPKKVVIIDGDVVAYLACLGRSKKKTVHGFYAIETVKPTHPKEYTPEENAEYLEECWEHFQKLTLDIVKITKASFFLMAMKGRDNYRDLIFPPDFEKGTGYKGTRGKKPDLTNNFVPQMRQMAIDAGIAIEAIGREADDMVRIWANEAIGAGHDFVIATIDKDLRCIPGKHHDLKKHVTFTVTPQYATRFYYTQLLMGDPTDNIPGLPGIGPKKAEAMLDPYDTEQEFQAVVIDGYKTCYGKEWREYLLANGKLIHIQKTITDSFNIRGWAQFAE